MPDDSRSLKVAIVAEHASASFGGEAILPLHYFRLLRSRGVEAQLVVHERTRGELERLLPNERERIHFVPDLWSQRVLWSVQRRLPARIGENVFGIVLHLITQLRQRRLVRRLVAAEKANLVHEPSPVGPMVPSAMFGLGAPVVIGPLNGGMRYPPGFVSRQSRAERVFMRLGRLFAHIVHYLIPGKRKAALVLVANERTRKALPHGIRGAVVEMPENGVDLGLFAPRSNQGRSSSLCRFVYVGRLVGFKAVDILLMAFDRVRREQPCELWLVGDGEEREAIERLIASLELRASVTCHGFVPQTRCPELIAQCDALVLPSLYECGGAVVLEAMAMEVPVIAARWGGPADYLDDDCGRLVDPSGGRDAFTERFAAAMLEIARAPELRRALGKVGRRRVESRYDWQRKVDSMLEHYHRVLERQGMESTGGLSGLNGRRRAHPRGRLV